MIRRYKSTDAAPLAELFYGKAAGGIDLGAWHRSFASNTSFVAELDGRLVGFADLDISSFCTACTSGYVNRVYVTPELRRNGIGRALVSALEKYAAENKVGVLSAEAVREALPFFEALNYSIVREDSENYLVRKMI